MTFWEMMNTVRFRDKWLRVRKIDDLGALRDLLVEWQTHILWLSGVIKPILDMMGEHEARDLLQAHFMEVNAMIERDVQTIDAYMKSIGKTR